MPPLFGLAGWGKICHLIQWRCGSASEIEFATIHWLECRAIVVGRHGILEKQPGTDSGVRRSFLAKLVVIPVRAVSVTLQSVREIGYFLRDNYHAQSYGIVPARQVPDAQLVDQNAQLLHKRFAHRFQRAQRRWPR